jgi:hypothetical protein
MTVAEPQLAPAPRAVERDAISRMIELSWAELYDAEPEQREARQLAALRQRFEQQMPTINALRRQADAAGVTRIDRIEDAVPLLFQDAVYKSYPVSLIEKRRFDRMTQWLAGYTSLDLSCVDVRGCDGIDSWLEAIDDQTPVRPIHTSGTSGKLSFFPRSTVEIELWFRNSCKRHEGYGPTPKVRLGHEGDVRMPAVAPTFRHGRYIVQRALRYIESRIAPSPDQLYTMSDGTLSADLVSLSGRIRIAQAKGDLASLEISEPMRIAMKRYIEDLERRPLESAAFFKAMVERLNGQRVFLNGVTNLIYEAAAAGLRQGVRGVFSPDSLGMMGGGGKGIVLPPNYLEVIREFTGIHDWKTGYGMSEMVSTMPMGEDGWYDVPTYIIPFLLDPQTGQLLPREGVVTGRFACHDLLAQTNWGGIISGDKVTIDWEGLNPFGRRGPRVKPDIERYSAAVTGEDKISCAATIDNTDTALKALLDL